MVVEQLAEAGEGCAVELFQLLVEVAQDFVFIQSATDQCIFSIGEKCREQFIFFCLKVRFDFSGKFTGDHLRRFGNRFNAAGVAGKTGEARQFEGGVMLA